MSHHHGIDVSPPIARWMKDIDTFDRSVFQRSVRVLGARVPIAKTAEMLRSPTLRRTVLDLPKVKSVVNDPEDNAGSKLLLLRIQNKADEMNYPLRPKHTWPRKIWQDDVIRFCGLSSTDEVDEILHAILPEELLDGAPSGFAAVGHVAHLNLNEEYLPYKRIIGQVFLDKNKSIRTVVNKLDSIHAKFRFFDMELIAGVPDYVVHHSEADCRFTFDFTKVYWNSRLSAEHERLVSLFQPEDVIADVFAGVGPFALPAAKRGCGVLANDLNPDSYHYLKINIEDNKVSERVRASCEDGKHFIRKIVWETLSSPLPAYEHYLTRSQERAKGRQLRLSQKGAAEGGPKEEKSVAMHSGSRKRIGHFVMNLPDSAITFLDAFRGLLLSENYSEDEVRAIYTQMPMVHCHCFTREMERDAAERDIMQRVAEQLGRPLTTDDEISLHLVRSVAPNKDMYCVSFRLPFDVAYGCPRV